ncbi:MAG TPA: 30S ribosomal protein S18 [Candidatus Kapabacteria bacterium]|nr:30S ribosomal protein S18 [Candidatus Kapabacteria bacterium]
MDYLDAKSLFRFTNDQGKILHRRITGVSAYQQRQVCDAIKYARHLALIPFVNHDTK